MVRSCDQGRNWSQGPPTASRSPRRQGSSRQIGQRETPPSTVSAEFLRGLLLSIRVLDRWFQDDRGNVRLSFQLIVPAVCWPATEHQRLVAIMPPSPTWSKFTVRPSLQAYSKQQDILIYVCARLFPSTAKVSSAVQRTSSNVVQWSAVAGMKIAILAAGRPYPGSRK